MESWWISEPKDREFPGFHESSLSPLTSTLGTTIFHPSFSFLSFWRVENSVPERRIRGMKENINRERSELRLLGPWTQPIKA